MVSTGFFELFKSARVPPWREVRGGLAGGKAKRRSAGVFPISFPATNGARQPSFLKSDRRMKLCFDTSRIWKLSKVLFKEFKVTFESTNQNTVLMLL